ncbi:MAG: membrane protein insertion efficiency factor YidD [Candidatus Thorarchaeota archaeon]
MSSFPWKEFIIGAIHSFKSSDDLGRVARVLAFMVRFYKTRFARSYSVCIYRPSCSTYALIAIHRYGAAKGLALAIHRLFRCRPPYMGGYDPVP